MVAETVTDVSKLLWAVVVMDADVWVEFGEALVLGVDFEALGVTCGETPGVDTLIVSDDVRVHTHASLPILLSKY